MINKDFKDNVILINVIPLIIIPIGKDYSKIMFFIGLSILLVCTILQIGMLYKIGKENKKEHKKRRRTNSFEHIRFSYVIAISTIFLMPGISGVVN